MCFGLEGVRLRRPGGHGQCSVGFEVGSGGSLVRGVVGPRMFPRG